VFLGVPYTYRIELLVTDFAGVSKVNEDLDHLLGSCGDLGGSIGHTVLSTFDSTFENSNVVEFILVDSTNAGLEVPHAS
jgi:hypothetical protein